MASTISGDVALTVYIDRRRSSYFENNMTKKLAFYAIVALDIPTSCLQYYLWCH